MMKASIHNLEKFLGHILDSHSITSLMRPIQTISGDTIGDILQVFSVKWVPDYIASSKQGFI